MKTFVHSHAKYILDSIGGCLDFQVQVILQYDRVNTKILTVRAQLVWPSGSQIGFYSIYKNPYKI
jgi:hypothetical protein